MASPYSENIIGGSIPSRSTSAPPSLDSNMLFAFPVASEYISAFSDIRNDNMYEEFYERFKEKLNIPPPLSDPLCIERNIPEENQRKYSDMEDGQTRSRSTSFLVSNVIDNCMKEEESPKNSKPVQLKVTNDFMPLGYDEGFFPVYSQFTLQHIYSHALEMSKDQVGCRLLQKKLEEKNPFTLEAIFEQIDMHIPEIMVDAFGNYFIQKLMEESDENIIRSIVNLVKPQMAQIALDSHGTRAIQKLIEVVVQYQSLIPAIISGLKDHEILLIKDMNGNHVIQRCLNSLGYPHNNFIYEIVSQNVYELATHRHGCCVLQRCIDAATISQRNNLVDKIIECAVDLVQDAFGNYVVQYIIDLNTPDANSRLAVIFIQSMQILATQKFSSNVIEKCLQQNTSPMQQMMIHEISQPGNIIRMINDQYANYVVQRALSLAEPPLLSKMLREIKIKADELKKTQFGKRIYAKLIKKYSELGEKPVSKRH
jgi:Pumilio-family RNA binding repeat